MSDPITDALGSISRQIEANPSSRPPFCSWCGWYHDGTSGNAFFCAECSVLQTPARFLEMLREAEQ